MFLQKCFTFRYCNSKSVQDGDKKALHGAHAPRVVFSSRQNILSKSVFPDRIFMPVPDRSGEQFFAFLVCVGSSSLSGSLFCRVRAVNMGHFIVYSE